MNKEQIAFAVAVVLLGAMWWAGGKEEEQKSRARKTGKDVAVEAPEEHKGYWIGDEDYAWSRAPGVRNPYLAPKDVSDLDKLDLGPPPFPRLPHHGLPLLPTVRGVGPGVLRHDLPPDPKIALPPPGTKASGGESANGGSSEKAKSELSEVDTSNVGAMSLADKIKEKAEEKSRRERREDDRRRAEAERKRGLDRVLWLGGDTMFGTIAAIDKKDDPYVIKDTIDRVRSDVTLSDEERKKRLDPIKILFREDKGAGKAPSRMVINALAVQRLEFAATPLNEARLKKLHTPPDDLGRQEDLAKVLFDAGEIAETSKLLEEMIGRNVTSPRVFGMLADCHRRLFRYDQELRSLERGLLVYAGDPGLLGRMGQLCLRIGLRGQAEEAFQKVLAADPANALAQLGLGQVLVERGNGDEAVVHLRQAETGVGLDKEQQLRTLACLGEAWCLKGNLQAAGTYFNQVLDRDPKNARAFAGSATVAFVGSGPAAAKAIVDRGREQAPLSGTLAYLDAVCQLRLGKWVEARDLLLVAMELDPLVTPQARTAMSYLLEKVGQDEAALGESEAALRADPQNVEARLQKARVLLNVGDYVTAKEDYLRVLEAMPDRVDILVALGDVSFKSGLFGEAARFYARAEAREPGFQDLLARRIVCDVRRRRSGGADELMKRVDAKLEQIPFVQAAEAYYYYEKKPDETKGRLQRIAEKKLGAPELQTYAGTTFSAVTDNEKKQKWVDNFNRTGGQFLREWVRKNQEGINVAVNDGRARFEGTQRTRSDEATVLLQERAANLVYSFSADLEMNPAPGTYMGVGILAFNQGKEPDPYPGLQKREGRAFTHLGLQIALAPHGKLQWRKIVQAKPTEWEDVPGTDYAGGPVTIGIELADVQKSVYRVLVDQHVVLPSVDLPGLSRRANNAELQVFCQAQVERPVSFAADNVTIVTYKK